MSAGNLLSLAGWTFLPNLVTGWVQSVYYGITIRAGDPKPQPGSPRFLLHRRRIHIIVVSAYLLYTIYEADWDIRRASDYYQDLGIPHNASDRDIKSRFRRLAAIHHPDKVSSSSPTSENYFVHLKLAQDTLLDPAKRFAYERFGPDIINWQRCSGVRDFVLHGLQAILPYYGAAAIFMYVLGLLGYLEWGKYWRWLTLIGLCVFELHTISRPHFPLFATNFLNPLLTTFTHHPPYLPYQLILLARKMSVTLYIAFAQIGPLLQPPTAVPANANPELALKQQLDKLEATAKQADLEATRLVQMELSPFGGDPQALKEVQKSTSEWLVHNTIRNDPEVKDAFGRTLMRRRGDAPAGARGNR
ncbi:membrane associated DnaJ chaperone-like protein [Mollisia scopiformis]|uniref:Membrane associated DnaJ chaperone-like protein n=1 Tax=Mollisia scopiformis TaxID=149040 RepID=A0A194XCY1_MOLSC|nr:membrane associated DnaJ chaperone-like protein [Mollisia scopiformis]KUJ18028.1 membrane associated DnaJ chaperone-like protein [Mollisia scopiformis]